ncbi:MAG: hypothetical protein HY342_08060 [Candidatus Lambdaproteobacteria bacterium]|nr:hypothetical protein [Candidatus Lambdaproteobacteria bacterium]
MDIGKKIHVKVSPFQLRVLGGTFNVTELVMEKGQSKDEFQQHLKGIPSDRWFVMLAEDDEQAPDTLAIIDDEFEFQIYAIGSFQNE